MERIVRGLRWLTGLSLGIGLLVLLNQLQIPFYLYYSTTVHTILISDSYDLYFFLISTACVPATLAISSRKLSKSGLIGIAAIWATGLVLVILGEPYGVPILYVTIIYAAVFDVSKAELRRSAAADVLLYALAIPVLVECSALFYWMGSAINPQGHLGLLSEQVEMSLTYSLFPIALLMMLLLLFSWLWVPLLIRFRNVGSPIDVRNAPNGLNIRLIVASLDLFVILALLVFFFPYLAGQPWIVGVDSVITYLKPLSDLAGLAPYQAFAASYTHGLYIALLYSVELVTGARPFSIVKFAPLVLAFAGASTVFLVILRGWNNLELAILSAICVLLWLPTTIGIYAGIQANWIAFVLWMLFLSFCFLNREWKAPLFLFQGLISLAIFLIHPWTWGVFVASLGLTTVISWRSVWKKRCLQSVLAALMLAVPVGLAAYLTLPGLGGDLENTAQLYSFFLIHPATLLSFLGTLTQLLFNWGPFLSPILLLICLVGTSRLSRDGMARNYLWAWVVVWCVGSVMIAPLGYNATNPALGETQLWRMLYASPLPILLAFGIEKSLDLVRHLETPAGSKRLVRPHYVLLSAIFAVFGWALFASSDPLIRLAIVLAMVASLVLTAERLPKYQIVRFLIASILILFVINAAYRSLYPLLLDPHNLLGTFRR